MSEPSTEKNTNVIVVATPGYSVLLDIGGITIPVDAFTPINLTSTFTEDVIASSFSLREHLKNGFLKEYVGESLPRDDNEKLISRLRESPTVKLATSVVSASELTTKSDKNAELTEEFVKNLSDRVQAHAKKTTEQLNAPDDEGEADQIVSGSPAPSNLLGKSLDENSLVKPVTMSVSPDKFKEFQTKTSKNS